MLTKRPFLSSVHQQSKESLKTIKELRSLAKLKSLKSLNQVIPHVDSTDWRIRMEAAKALKNYIINGQKNVQKKAYALLHKLRDDIHPVVRLCVMEIKKTFRGNCAELSK